MTPLDVFESILLDATASVSTEYMQLPVAGAEDPAYRERVYCYELYHQMRSRWPNWPFSLAGEIDKSGHPIIRGDPLLDRSKPDFLVHVPGTMGRNLAIVEVKPANASPDRMAQDVNKLAAFIQKAGYLAGFILVYGHFGQAGVVSDYVRKVGFGLRFYLHEPGKGRAKRVV